MVCKNLQSDRVFGELGQALDEQRHRSLDIVAAHLDRFVLVSGGGLGPPITHVVALDPAVLKMGKGGKPEHLESFAAACFDVNSFGRT